MPTFTLRFLDGYSKRVALEETFEADTDRRAVSLAGQRRGLAPMELVREGKVVRAWPSFPPSD
jgi:hypothetical protein